VDYGTALRELYGLSASGIRPGLERMRRVLARAGHPETRLGDVVHVAGTNGKGSIASMVFAGLGGTRGLFTSPHLHRLLERFRVAGAPEVAEQELADAWVRLKAHLDEATPLTFFEAITVLAMDRFAARGVDATVLEVGLGGRLDSTNVVHRPAVCVVSRVHYDHQRFLGDTLTEIAREKAGIGREGVPMLVGRQEPEAMASIEAEASRIGAPLLRLGHEILRDGDEVRFEGVALPARPALLGAHQRDNAALAAVALELLRRRGHLVDPEAAMCPRWPGRLERPVDGVLLDGAHNPDGARALAEHLESAGPRRRVLVFASKADKDWPSVLRHLEGCFEARVSTSAGMATSEDPASLGGEVVPDPWSAFERARELAGEDGEVVVAGSLFVIAAIRGRLLGIANDPLIAM
jgi:dihydrofolate synthase/folylpolyglutamate synthase